MPVRALKVASIARVSTPDYLLTHSLMYLSRMALAHLCPNVNVSTSTTVIGREAPKA